MGRWTRNAGVDHLFRGKKGFEDEASQILRGRRSGASVNHLIRGGRADINYLIRGKKSMDNFDALNNDFYLIPDYEMDI